MPSELPNDRAGNAGAEGLSPQQQSRRRLLRGGAAAPVVLTVASQPVLAGNGTCQNASAFASLNGSRPATTSTCNGKYPSWWCNSLNSSYWPTKYPKTTLFSACLASYSPCNTLTLLEVMQLPDTTGSNCVAKHMVAALLNAATYRTTSVLDEAKVKLMWQQYLANGHKYQPSSGIWWFADYSNPAAVSPYRGGITEWLQSTMV